jgi:hypothetical protein
MRHVSTQESKPPKSKSRVRKFTAYIVVCGSTYYGDITESGFAAEIISPLPHAGMLSRGAVTKDMQALRAHAILQLFKTLPVSTRQRKNTLIVRMTTCGFNEALRMRQLIASNDGLKGNGEIADSMEIWEPLIELHSEGLVFIEEINNPSDIEESRFETLRHRAKEAREHAAKMNIAVYCPRHKTVFDDANLYKAT